MNKFYHDRWKASFIRWEGGPDFSIGMDVSLLSGQPLDLGPKPGKYYHEGVLPVHYGFYLAHPSQLTEENSLNRLSTMIQQMAQLEEMNMRYYEFNPYELREITVKFFPELLHRVDDVFFGEIKYNYGEGASSGREAFFKKHPDLTWFDTPFSEAHEISPTTKRAAEFLNSGNVKASRNNLERSFISWFHNRMKDATSQTADTRALDFKVWDLIKTNPHFTEKEMEKVEQDLIAMIDSIINAQLQPHSSPPFSIHRLLVTLNTEGWKALRSIWTRFQLWKENRSKHQSLTSVQPSTLSQHSPPSKHRELLSMAEVSAQQERAAFDEQSRLEKVDAQLQQKEAAAQEKILVKQMEEQLNRERILAKEAADLVAEQKKTATLAEKQRLEEKLRQEKLKAEADVAAEKKRRLLIAMEEEKLKEKLKEEKKRIEILQKEELKKIEMLKKEELKKIEMLKKEELKEKKLQEEAWAKKMNDLAIKTEAERNQYKIRQYQQTGMEMDRQEKQRREKEKQKREEEAQRKEFRREQLIIEENEEREKQKLKAEKDRIYEIKKTNDESKGKQLKVFEENLKTSFTEEIIRGIEAQSEETMENFIKETKEKVQADIKEMREGYTVVRSRDTALKSNQTAAIKIIDDLYEKWKENKKSTKKDAIEMIESREGEIRDEIVKTKKYGEDLLTYLGKSFDELIKNVEKLKLSVKDKEELLEKARSNFQVIADSFAPDSTIQNIITDISEINDLADLKRYLNDLSSKTNNSLHHHLKQLLHKDGGTNIKLLVDKLKEKTGSEANWLVSTDGIFLDTVELSKQNMKDQERKKREKKELAKQKAQEHPSAAYVAPIYTGNEKADREREQYESMLKTAAELPRDEKKEPERNEEKVRTTTSTKKTLGGKMKNMSKKNNKRTMNRFKIVRKINKNSKRKMNRFTKNRRKRSIKNKRSIYRNFIFSRNIF